MVFGFSFFYSVSFQNIFRAQTVSIEKNADALGRLVSLLVVFEVSVAHFFWHSTVTVLYTCLLGS